MKSVCFFLTLALCFSALAEGTDPVSETLKENHSNSDIIGTISSPTEKQAKSVKQPKAKKMKKKAQKKSKQSKNKHKPKK